ncbi:MAG: biotin--[acetyl-CoA-carboxylase] ligase, partial [Dehalococcoidales bacterium]
MIMDVLSPELVTDGLETRFIGQRVLYFPAQTSTMVAARQEARQMAAEGTVVITGEQTAGRGRAKRVWLSPRGSIALSIVLYPDVSQLPYLIMIASVAAARSIETVTGLETQLKWPNDVLVNGRKVCGILIENELKGSRVAWAVIGIGINV